MDTKSSSAVEPEEWEIVLTRVFDLPRELVFKAWTGPKHLAQWWGPKGFTNPLCELDVRPGGSIRIHMCGPDGILYPMTGVYQEIMEPVRLVFTSAALDKEGNPILELLNTVTFAEHSGKTTLTTKARVVKTTPEGAPYLEGSEAGWTQSLERLGNLLASTYSTRRRKLTQRTEDPASSTDREIAATRVINAPRELVFRMWTDPEQVAQWWGPNGFTNTIYEMAVRPGGVWRFVMHGPDGVDYQNTIVFIEIVEPEWLAYSDVSGPQFQVTVTFADQGDKTRVSVQTLFESTTPRDKMAMEFGAIEGLSQTLDRLEAHVAKIQERERP